MSDWRILPLGDSLDALIDNRGKNPPYEGDGVPAISGMCVGDGILDLSVARRVSVETWKRWMAVPTRRNDVVLTSEAPLGRVALVPNDEPLVLTQRVFGLRGKLGVLDSRFLYYALQSSAVRVDLHGRATGTTVLGIRQPSLRRVRIPAPGFQEQRAIAEVLGALDDKIAANAKLAASAGELAVAMFAAANRGAKTGDTTFDDFAEVGGGGTPRTSVSEFWDGGIPWATPTDVTGLSGPYLTSTTRTISSEGLAACSSSLYPSGSILMTSRATIGAFAVAEAPTAVNQGFIVANAKDTRFQWWLFHDMRSRVDEFVSFANGATFLELSRGRFKKLLVRVAPEPEMVEFGERVGPLHRLASHALQESRTLAGLRDTLLPQLMSGKLRVKDAEKQVEEAV